MKIIIMLNHFSRRSKVRRRTMSVPHDSAGGKRKNETLR